MWLNKSIWLCSILIIGISTTGHSLPVEPENVETRCDLPVRGRGICKDISLCPAALSSLRSGVRDIVKCSGPNPKIICCPTTLRPSAEKCHEYMSILKNTRDSRLRPLISPDFLEDDDEDDAAREEEIKCSLTLNALISGGRPAEVGEFPHVAVMGYNVSRTPWRCGGTLISERWVLTAAHCINNPSAGQPLKILLGDVTLSKGSSKARQIVEVEEIIVHPLYNPPQTYHDLALVRLAKKVKLSRSILPACLAQPEDDLLKGIENRTLNVAGWGVLGTGEPQSDVLQVAGLSGFNLKNCNAFYNDVPAKNLKFPAGITRTQICAGDRVGKKDTCKGDSGGPMWVTKTERCVYYLLGITSFGPNQCGEKVPGIYTNILSYLDWIEEIVWPEFTTVQ